MGMPIEVEVLPRSGQSPEAVQEAIDSVFAYLTNVDERFSTYKYTSEISQVNRGEIALENVSDQMKEVFALAEQTRKETNGYFNIRRPDGLLDPSGIVKGWAIRGAAARVVARGFMGYFINAGGDIAMGGTNDSGAAWAVGIRNPFKPNEIVKVVYPQGRGVTTSGSYERGAHIYNPHAPSLTLDEVVSITVIGPDVLEADRFATAAFAMGKKGIQFIEQLPGLEGYAIDKNGIATMTCGFEKYTKI